MKKTFKYLIIVIVCLAIIGISLLYYNKYEKNDNVSSLKKYDLAITRKDINCSTNTIYLKKDEIYIVYFDGDKSKNQEIVKIKRDINVNDMVNYVKDYGKENLDGLVITLKDGTTKAIDDKDNIIADFLREEELIDTFCDRKISSNYFELKCFEKELNRYILSEKESIDIPLNEITDKSDQIVYYKGVKSNDENIYIIVEANLNNEREVIRDFELYFAKRYSIYQKYNVPNTDIYVYTYNGSNDMDFEAIRNKCNRNDFSNHKGKKISSKTLNNLKDTNKIIIKAGDDEIGTINNNDAIDKILDIISTSRQYGDAFFCDGHNFDFEMYNEKNELIDTIYVWHDGGRLIPKSVHGGCAYYLVTNNDIDLREVIEKETDYVFYALFDYSEDCIQEPELIYEDSKYNYYLKCQKSNEVFISFNVKYLTMTLKYALNNNYIKIDKLEKFTNLIEKKSK